MVHIMSNYRQYILKFKDIDGEIIIKLQFNEVTQELLNLNKVLMNQIE